MTATLPTKTEPATPPDGEPPPQVRSRSGGEPGMLIIRLLALMVGVSAALPLAYLVTEVWSLGWSETWEIVRSDSTWRLLVDTLRLVLAVTAAAVAISLPLAWLTTRTDLPLRRFWVIVTALPLAIPTYVGSFAMIGALGPRGALQSWLGVDRVPSIYGFWGAFAVLTLFTYPYVLLPVRAAYRRIDPSLEEASRTLGRGSFATFVRVVVPQLRPSIIAGSLLVALYVLSDFGAVAMLRYGTFTRAIYNRLRGALNPGSAAVLGLVLVVLTVVVLAVEQRFRGRENVHRLHGGGARRARVARLGWWRWPAFGACSLLVTVALIVPMSVIGYWLWRGAQVGEAVLPEMGLIWRSLYASALGAVVTVAAAFPIAVLSVRRRGVYARVAERLAWSGYALPGVVVAFSLVFFTAPRFPWLYQTTGLLVFAYVVLFLPQAIGAMRSSLLQVTPSLEEASRLLGSGPLRTQRRVVLPLIRPGIVAGGALVFLTCMKELPATLMLAPTGFDTLATRVWNAHNEAFLARAASAAFGLVLLSSLPMAALVAYEADRRSPRSSPSSPEVADDGDDDQLAAGTDPASAAGNATDGPPVAATATR